MTLSPETIIGLEIAAAGLVLVALQWAKAKVQQSLNNIHEQNEQLKRRNTLADRDLREIVKNVRTIANGHSVHHATDKARPQPREEDRPKPEGSTDSSTADPPTDRFHEWHQDGRQQGYQ